MSRFKWEGASHVWRGRDFSRLVFVGWMLVALGLVAAYSAFVFGLAWLLTWFSEHPKAWPQIIPFSLGFVAIWLIIYLWPRKV